MGTGSTLLPAPIAHPTVADVSLAGCSPAEPAYVLIGNANVFIPVLRDCDQQDQQHTTSAGCRCLGTHAPDRGELTNSLRKVIIAKRPRRPLARHIDNDRQGRVFCEPAYRTGRLPEVDLDRLSHEACS